jgi:glycosyltransferase involved in cell wall biosynthesis
MRVLHVMPWFYPAVIYGGPTHSVYELARATARQGHDVRVLTTNANGSCNLSVDCQADTEMDGVTVRYCNRWFDDSISPQLLARLAGEIRRADVVHLGLTYSFPVLPTLALCRWYGKPVVWSPRGALQRYPYSRRRFAKRLWELVCRAVAPRDTVLHVTCDVEAVESTSRMPRPATVVPNGVEVPEHVSRTAAAGMLRMMYLGRLHPKKGIENLLAACSTLPKSLGWTLNIVGAGEAKYEARLRSRIADLGLTNRVRMSGMLTGEAKTEAFEHCDMAVFPSYTENFGMVVAEALAHGVPVITSKGMPWSRVEEVGCGMWIDNDARSLCDAMMRACEMPLREMGERGREWVRREFSWDEAASRMIATYQALIDPALPTTVRERSASA